MWSVAFKLVADLRFAVSLDHGVAIRKPADRGGVITQVARRVAVDAAVRIESRILLDTLAARSGCHLANMVAVDVPTVVHSANAAAGTRSNKPTRVFFILTAL